MEQEAKSGLNSSHWASPVHARFRQRDQALLRLGESLVKEQGIVSFRFSELAPRAGCSAGTLYKHFNCKEDLLVAIFAKHVELLTERQPELMNADLNHAERWLAMHLYGAMAVAHTSWSLGFNALAGAEGIVDKVSDYRLQEMQMFVDQACSTAKRVVEAARIEGQLVSDDQEIEVAHATMVACQRGATTMINNPMIAQNLNFNQIHKLYDSLALITGTLNWRVGLIPESRDRVIKAVEEQLIALEQEHDLTAVF